MKFNVSQILEKVVELNASDLHLNVATAPVVRINTVLTTLQDIQPLTIEDIEYFLSQILTQEQKDILDVNKEIDFSIALGKKVRFRVNAFYQKGYPSVAMRTVPLEVPQLDTLNLPSFVEKLCSLTRGLMLVVGPTGHGKSTTIAAMLDYINANRSEHIITIEDPIEYIFTNKKSLIVQREMHLDTHSWEVALKSALRQDPNIIFIGEMRDYDTISSAITLAETGHLVFATLHTNSASQSIDRIIDSFPETQQKQVRMQLSLTLEAVISQRLLQSDSLGMLPATELMLASNAIRNLIREGKTPQIDNVISTSADLGMMTLESSLAKLVNDGKVSAEEAYKHTVKPMELRRLLKGA